MNYIYIAIIIFLIIVIIIFYLNYKKFKTDQSNKDLSIQNQIEESNSTINQLNNTIQNNNNAIGKNAIINQDYTYSISSNNISSTSNSSNINIPVKVTLKKGSLVGVIIDDNGSFYKINSVWFPHNVINY